jgi:hypothetical protein
VRERDWHSFVDIYRRRKKKKLLFKYLHPCHYYIKIRHLQVRFTFFSSAVGLRIIFDLLEIFVGGLPYHTTDETLRKFFERFGEIEEAVVCNLRRNNNELFI